MRPPLDENQRRAVGLTRRNKRTGLLAMPGYGAINDIVNRIDPVELARALNGWLTANSELLPKSLALDGKDLGAKGRLGGIVTLCHHATGQPLAQRTYSGRKDDCELPVAQRLLDKDAADQLSGALITGDALNSQKKAFIIPGHGGEYLLGLKDNQPTLHQLAQTKLPEGVPDEWVGDWEKGHGRIERRRLARVGADWDTSLFPGARQFVRSTREWWEGRNQEIRTEIRYFITSLEGEEKSAALLAQAVRGHWSVENKKPLQTRHLPMEGGRVTTAQESQRRSSARPFARSGPAAP